MRNYKYLVPFSFIFIQSCASTPPIPPPSPITEITNKTCDKEVNLTNAISLLPKKKNIINIVTTVIDSSKPCLTIDEKPSNYLVYSLPDHSDNHTITIGGQQELYRTFGSSVSLLDSNGKVTRSFADEKFATLGTIYGVQFRPSEQEKYIIIRSNPKLVGIKTSANESRVLVGTGYSYNAYGGTTYNTYRGTEGTVERVYSHEGTVVVTIQAIKGKIGLPDEK